MRIGILNCNLGYEEDLKKYYIERQHHVKIISDQELLEVLPRSFLPTQKIDDEKQFEFFILNIKASSTIERVLEIILNLYEGSIWRPRIILLSNLLSWSGKRYHVPIGRSITEFTSRVPSPKEISIYKLENMYHSCATITGMQMCIVSFGLLYGGRGFHFHNLFKSIWESNKDKTNNIFSLSNGANYVPMIHIKDLIEIVGKLTLIAPFPSFFIPATDGCTSNLSTIADYLSAATKRNVGITNKEEAIEIILNTQESDLLSNKINCPHRLWNIDIKFSDSARLIDGVFLSYPNGMIDFVSDVWKEFVAVCATEPCSFLITGPPSSLKTSIAKELSQKLEIAYIDAIEAMKFVVEYEESHETIERVGSSKATDVSHTLDLAEITEPGIALKIELGRVLTVQINGEKKKGKVDESPVDLKSVNWTPNLIAALPPDLIRRCAKLKILEDLVCVRSGYVLDLWGQIKDLEHIYEVTGTLPDMEDPITKKIIQQQQSFSLEGFDDGSPNSKNSVSPRAVKPNNSSHLVQKKPQLIIELQSPDNVTTERVLASMGCENGTKLNKEQQSIIKDLESKLSQYSAKLIEVSLPSINNGNPFKTAPLIRTLDEIGYHIQRVDVSLMNGRGEGDAIQRNKNLNSLIVEKIYGEYVRYFGRLPWITNIEEESNLNENLRNDINNRISEHQQNIIDQKNDTLNEQKIEIFQCVNENEDESGMEGIEQENYQDFSSRKSIDEIHQKLDLLKDDVKIQILHNVNDLQNYLVENVLPHVAEALVTITREKVEDPILYLATFLNQRGEEIEEQETTAAYEKFLTAVQQAEALEEEAAAQLLAISKRNQENR